MPEWGMLPIPQKLLKQGVRDMLRISDARMSGTSYGACVLHVAPESYVGGNLALVKTGDLITRGRAEPPHPHGGEPTRNWLQAAAPNLEASARRRPRFAPRLRLDVHSAHPAGR
jgi:hypothetical protein